jgi:colanic acid/amylovoran biosynthesis glycosyltransferase
VNELLNGESLWQRAAMRTAGQLAPDVIHAHFGPNGCAMLPIAKALDIPLVTSFYGVDISVLPRRPQWRDRYAALFGGGHLFLAEGPEMRRKVVGAGAPADRVAIQRIAIPFDRYPQWTPSRSPKAVLFVGRMVEKKGLEYAVRAFAAARRQIPDLVMRIIGEGPEQSRCLRWIEEHKLTTVVTFLGMQPHTRVIEELQQAHALLHPSLTADDGDSEGGAPTILLEAQAIGTPIVSSYHADIPNVLPAGPGVRLCPEKDVEALATGLIEVISAGARVDSRFVRAHHDVVTEIHQLEAKYDQLTKVAIAI